MNTWASKRPKSRGPTLYYNLMIKLIVYLLFYGLIFLVAAYSLIMVYILLRFGKSKILGVVLGAFYLLIMLSLYAAAEANLSHIPLPQT